MKQSKEKCAKPAPPPKPNLKNKTFLKWSRAEPIKRDDNIITTPWHETLKTTDPFVPAYDNAPICMNLLLSGEYGRIWQKERDDWYKNIFVPKGKEKDMEERRKKIRMEAKAAKKKAEKEAKERRERRAKEAEIKAKIEAEKAEKIKAKIQKYGPAKKNETSKKKRKDTRAESIAETPEVKKEVCPKGWVPVELTMQCECSDDKKEDEQKDVKSDAEQNCVMCNDYMQQLRDVQNVKAETETVPNYPSPCAEDNPISSP